MKKDKQKVLDEVWDDARIRSFLATAAPARSASGAPADQAATDHACLLRAYRSMRADDFARFLAAYTGEGRDLDARDADGDSLADIVARHRKGTPYLDHLLAAGATAPATAPEATA